MNRSLLQIVCNEIDVDERGGTSLLIRLGHVNKEMRFWLRETVLVWQAWKRHYTRLKPGRICETSVHRRDLSLTNRSRCYTANSIGIFVPHGGNGSERCMDPKHYYSNTLEVVFPRIPTNSVLHKEMYYCRWLLIAIRRDYAAKTRRNGNLDDIWHEHREACRLLAERPWLHKEVSNLLQKDATSKSALSLKRSYQQAAVSEIEEEQ